jgi:hypothetical protein
MRHVWLMLVGLAGCGGGGRVEFLPEPGLVLPAVTVVPGRVVTVAGQLELRNGTSEARRLEVRVTPEDGALSVSVEGSPTIEPGATRGLDVRASLSTPGTKRWTVEVAGAVAVVTSEAVEAGPCVLLLRSPQPLPNALVREAHFENTGAATCFLREVFVDGVDSLRVVPSPALVRPLPPGGTIEVRIEGTVGERDAAFLVIEPFQGPRQRIALTRPCGLVASPASLDFGEVQEGCASPSRTLQFYSTCKAPVSGSIGEVSVPGFELLDGPRRFTLREAGLTTAVVRFSPQSSSPATARLVVTLDGDDAPSATVELVGRRAPRLVSTDRYSQPPPGLQDVLIVADTGATVRSAVENLRPLHAFSRWPLSDSHYALTTWGSDGALELLSTGSRVVNGRSPTLDPLINAWPERRPRVAGASCLDTALRALSEPLRSGLNAGFRRAQAPVWIVCLSDRSDETARSVPALVADLRREAGQVVMVHSIGATGPTLSAVVRETGGVVIGLDELLSDQFGRIGGPPRTTFFLNGLPAGDSDIEVLLNGQPLPPTDATGAPVWRLEAPLNAVVFRELVFGELEIRYRLACL